MNLQDLNNDQLHLATVSAAERERVATVHLLWHLRENEKRMLFAIRGHKDLKTYCVKELKLSEGSSWRRIAAMKLLRELPEAVEKLKSGDLNLTQVCQAQTFFRQEHSTTEQKREILNSIENHTSAQTERILCERGMQISQEPCREKPIKGGRVELTLILDTETLQQMEEIEVLTGKKTSKLELVKLMTRHMLRRLRRDRKSKATSRATAVEAPGIRKRSISRSTKREIKIRDEDRCQYRTALGRQCEAKLQLQFEHRVPWAKGGTNQVENLELLCPHHNRLRAVQQFGRSKMKEFSPALK